jgi:hypothetical protein
MRHSRFKCLIRDKNKAFEVYNAAFEVSAGLGSLSPLLTELVEGLFSDLG